MEGADVIFVTTALGVYIIDLKLARSKKLSDKRDLKRLFPFMHFYSPPGISALIPFVTSTSF
jgi:hypothetical protein